jgi:hypothetical protein
VLAAPAPGSGALWIAAVIQGNDQIGSAIADPVTTADSGAGLAAGEPDPTPEKPLLLARDAVAKGWTSFGTIGAEHAGWPRQLVATRSVPGAHPRPVWPVTIQMSFDLSDAGWRQRVALVLPRLEADDHLVGQIAWGELERAPYAALSAARSRVDPATVTRWLDDPALASRYATYVLLLGFVGGPADSAYLEDRLEAAWKSHDSANLGAMIAADLELRGPARLEWIEESYFADRARTLPEIDAVLLALSILGDANDAVPRDRVIEAFEDFIQKRGPMAGFVAPILAGWNYWGARREYAALLDGKAIKDPASEFAVVNYLQGAAAATSQ